MTAPTIVTPDNSQLNEIRLNTLVKLAASPPQAIRASRVASDAMLALGVRACIIQRWDGVTGPKTIALQKQGDLDQDHLEQFATEVAAEVIASRESVRIDNLMESHPSAQLLTSGWVAGYMAVPMFDSKGGIAGVAAVVGGPERHFDDEDEWWLRTASQMVSTGLTCETLSAKLLNLDQAAGAQPVVAAPRPADVVKPTTSPQTEVRKPSVLLVDDDRAVNNVLRRFLVNSGYQVDSAFDPHEAIKVFQPSTHDVVISDVNMPNMNGWELIAALRETAPKIPIILITGYSSNCGAWNQGFLRQQGIVALLSKPIDFDYLAGMLKDTLRAK